MLRRRLIIEWNDEGTDSDKECADTFCGGDWTIQDLLELDRHEEANPQSVTYITKLKVWVEDAPKEDTP